MSYTPMIQQYLQIKAEYKDCFLFFRLGDFYEMFFEDAKKAAMELEITLTSRDGGGEERIPMCGVPFHSSENYIKTLINKGYKVAICEQVEDPKATKGVVKREVVQLITPGTVMEGNMLDEKENNYLAVIRMSEDRSFALAYSDLSTGETFVMQVNTGWDTVVSELYNRPIKEVIVDDTLEQKWLDELQLQLQLTVSYIRDSECNEAIHSLVEHIHDPFLQETSSVLYQYLYTTQKRAFDHLKEVQVIELEQYMQLDMSSKRNLEISTSMMRKEKYGSLLWVLDRTVTAMGARKLKKWLEKPLLHVRLVEQRLELVEGVLSHFMARDGLREALQSIYDLERLSGRVSFGNVNARDLFQLKRSLEKVPEIIEQLQQFDHPEITKLSNQMDPIPSLVTLLNESIEENAPISITEGNIIKDGYHEQLDQYRDASRNGKEWIAALEQQERQATGIKSLKIGYNKVFGYYIEVTRANLHLVPNDRYERKQTLTNAERFITEELKEKEATILEAEEKSVDLEYDLFIQLREKVKAYIPQIQRLADMISDWDVLQSFATVSDDNNYVRPSFTDSHHVQLQESRHPVVEKVMKDETFVPNHVTMEDDKHILLITGPNMSGKSTYMRQLALIIIMGQIGCFVPCKEATLPIFDKIFTRIGAADDLVSGQSTFMVEMLEANHALQQATDQSLILLDEVGRGTSTYDGMALAQAIVEYIHHHIQAKTLFSTHYHELTSLADSFESVKNIHVRAEEMNGHVVFLHQIQEGAADESYGIHVAKLAGLPDELIERASVILEQLENKDPKHTANDSEARSLEQMSFFAEEPSPPKKKVKADPIQEKIMELNLLEMTPMEAMNQLYELQRKAKENKG
ncbi:DNA mismatch repair protein MutS [Gracilibacillus halophilus YIM-C55.5]|uniref:DNA mismatch repair protein MutS n=1 Tax=Gracilibacillus halophilus YIM-C55.5 TaxID=1308866 RepID=N4WBP4_9BACI|nr:DNA mismatch repair protein MutS [Gracilibacillus halophilus]ENH96674.1 DNA mismatch repair protein MutS [Gracilibacillus halophilus YIM-C55.5]